jgi:hypothetical protein
VLVEAVKARFYTLQDRPPTLAWPREMEVIAIPRRALVTGGWAGGES